MWTLPAPAELEQLLDKAADLPPALAGDLSAPLAMAMPPEWQESQHKILIVGQETLGWDYRWSADDWKSGLLDGPGRSDRAKALINAYEAFDLAASQPKSVRSPFWRAQRALADRFEGGDYRKVLWTNLSRCDTTMADHGVASVWKTLSYEDLDTMCHWQSPLLRAEIANSGAKRVIFFTGPNYDYLLDRTFSAVQYKPVFDGVAEREAARMVSPDLPLQSFRLYHPAYLQRRSLPHLEALLDLLSA